MNLSPQQRTVATLIARGLSGPAIAQEMGLSPHTVGVHRYNLMRKLGVHSSVGIVHHAIKEGWVRIGEVED